MCRSMDEKKTVLLAGGGTLGPVTALLAVVRAWRRRGGAPVFVWAGTPSGPERVLIEAEGIIFYAIPVFRLPRYVSLEWILLPWSALRALWASWRLLVRVRPEILLSAAGFTSVPVAWACWLKKIPIVLHNQDVAAVLASKLIAPCADEVTVAWPQTLAELDGAARVIGNPVDVRPNGRSEAAAPLVLFVGGGTGSQWLNARVYELTSRLSGEARILHVTGRTRSFEPPVYPGYTTVELLDRTAMTHALEQASVVVSRAGMGLLSELAALKKAAILVPLPDSPQERNAAAARDAHGAIVCIQAQTTADDLLREIRELLSHPDRRRALGEQLSLALPTESAADTFVEIAQELLN